MFILIRTGGGGGIVLLIVLALLYDHGGGVSGTVGAVLLGLVVLVVLAIMVTLAVLVRRLLPPRESASPRTVVQVVPEHGQQAAEIPQFSAPAIGAPVRLPEDQLEQLAELIRRGRRPDR